MRSRILTCCLTTGLLLAARPALHAADTNAPAPPPPGAGAPPQIGPPPNGANMPPRVRPNPGVMPGSPLSVLSQEQRDSFEKNLNDARGEIMGLNSKLQAARQEITDAMFALKVDENQIRQKVMAEAEVEADIAVIRAKAFSGIQPPLTADELDKFKHFQAAPMRMGPRPMPPQSPPGTNHAGNGLPPKQ